MPSSIVERERRLLRPCTVARGTRPSVQGQTRPRAGVTIGPAMSTPDRNATAARPKAVRSIRAWGARRIARVALLLGLAAASTGGAQPDGEDPARLFETTPEQFV